MGRPGYTKLRILPGAPHHPRSQGKIERRYQSIKNLILLENQLLPSDPERQTGAFVDHDNNYRHHESLSNLTPDDTYHWRGAKILKMREEIETQAIRKCQLQHQVAT